MQKILFVFTALLLINGCDNAKEAGDETARAITGANMIEQGRDVQQKLHAIDRQQQQRFEQLDQQ